MNLSPNEATLLKSSSNEEKPLEKKEIQESLEDQATPLWWLEVDKAS